MTTNRVYPPLEINWEDLLDYEIKADAELEGDYAGSWTLQDWEAPPWDDELSIPAYNWGWHKSQYLGISQQGSTYEFDTYWAEKMKRQREGIT